jgi:hypothetical protein
VKTWVKTRLKSEILTFFTTRGSAVSWANSHGTVSDGPTGDDRLICNANDLLDGTFRCRIILRRKARTTSAGLGQLPTGEEENFVEATATDGSD